MKKLLIIVLLAVTSLANAQEHLKIKGVEINGSFDNFVYELSTHGCSYGTNMHGFFMIKGEFAGVEMFFFPQVSSSGNVYSVVVCSSTYKERSALNARYNELYQLLTQKYGTSKRTRIENGYYRNLYGPLVDGKASKTVVFESINGLIYLYLHKSDYPTIQAGEVNMIYIDKANDQLRLREANTDI